MTVQPFQINVPEAVLQDLKERLANTRWPDEVVGAGWDYGTNLGYMKELADYWLHRYDWRKQEAMLNKFAWFTATIDGVEVRFIHERGKGPNPTPLILFHGWPDSICRYLKLIPMLTDPAKYGSNPENSFDVVVPSFIGFSGKSKAPSKHLLKDISELSWLLMTDGLGYSRFGAGGGDGGSPISQLLGVYHPESIIGLHLTDIGYHTTMAQYSDLSEAEQRYLNEQQTVGFREGAYAMQMGTKPQTLAYGLNDSPAGMAAWIVEKIRSWSDCDGEIEKLYTKDEILTNIMQYWLVGPTVRAFSYREEWVSPSLKPDQQVNVPVAVANPPKDINPIPPREFAERNLKNIQQWTVLAHGGHFAAMEFPELMAEDIRAFFRPFRKSI
ncbi:MAG TPA: epoxide hydrolase [Methanotrichaceae archaeon]|nr:epoxide hydrolase [Methanotrichaceae archaeon]